ncbi:MAG: tyrosine-type recombinase/integrase [Gammaproteobacteria bacterium]|nr:tyrosine-type recombinase/integrase [Gammaproteobacteria bacterium]
MHSFDEPSELSLSDRYAGELFKATPPQPIHYPIQHVEIDWEYVRAGRKEILDTVEEMPAYLLHPEVRNLIAFAKENQKLLLELLWATGARVSELLALTPERYYFNGYRQFIVLDTLKRRGRPKKKAIQRSPKRYIPICDEVLSQKIRSFLAINKFRKGERIFKVQRQTVNRWIKACAEKGGGAPFSISSHTFRHSFAIHLLLHGRPLKYVSKLLGHSSVKSTEIYNNVLTFDGAHLMEGIDFH